jgi:hypothetical protein
MSVSLKNFSLLGKSKTIQIYNPEEYNEYKCNDDMGNQNA